MCIPKCRVPRPSRRQAGAISGFMEPILTQGKQWSAKGGCTRGIHWHWGQLPAARGQQRRDASPPRRYKRFERGAYPQRRGRTIRLGGVGLRKLETNIWAGPIIMTADSTFANYGGGNLRIIGPISGAGGLIELYGGFLSLEGTNANTYAGNTVVSIGRWN